MNQAMVFPSPFSLLKIEFSRKFIRPEAPRKNLQAPHKNLEAL
jgi:hypothetical protein